MTIDSFCSKQLKCGFPKGHPTTGIFLVIERAFDQAQFDGLFYSLTKNGLNRKLFRYMSDFFYQIKLIISINNQLSHPITPFHVVTQVSSLLYVSDMPQIINVQINLSKFADNISISGYAPGVRSINFQLQKCLNQISTWCDRSPITLNRWKAHLINFSQIKIISVTSTTFHE